MKICLNHRWSEWGPPYEAFGYLGRVFTYQQKECESCGARRKRQIGPKGHARAIVPMSEERSKQIQGRVLQMPTETQAHAEIAPPKPKKPRRPDMF